MLKQSAIEGFVNCSSWSEKVNGDHNHDDHGDRRNHDGRSRLVRREPQEVRLRPLGEDHDPRDDPRDDPHDDRHSAQS